MAGNELIEDKVFAGKYTGQLNKLYHHTMSWRYGVLDRTIRVAVGVLAIASFTASLLTSPNAPFPISATNALLLSFASMTAAIILNVVPIGDFYKRYNESYRSWTTHCARWENVETRIYGAESPDVSEFLREVNELITERNHIESSESAGWPRLLRRCQAEVNSMFFGEKNPARIREVSKDEPKATSKQE